jgi:hypothetical protein
LDLDRTRFLERNVHLDVASRRGAVNGLNHTLDMWQQRWPLRMAYHYDCDQTMSEVLLITKILVGGEKNLIAVLLGGNQQLTVPHAVPTEIRRNADLMNGQVSPYRDWRPLVEENAHFKERRLAVYQGCGPRTR